MSKEFRIRSGRVRRTPDQRDPLERSMGSSARERPDRVRTAPVASWVARDGPGSFVPQVVPRRPVGTCSALGSCSLGVGLNRRRLDCFSASPRSARDSRSVEARAPTGPMGSHGRGQVPPRPVRMQGASDRSAGATRRASSGQMVFKLPRRECAPLRVGEHPLHRGRVDGATSISPAVGVVRGSGCRSSNA